MKLTVENVNFDLSVHIIYDRILLNFTPEAKFLKMFYNEDVKNKYIELLIKKTNKIFKFKHTSEEYDSTMSGITLEIDKSEFKEFIQKKLK